MARIVYAVAGEGFGHGTRSQMIGQRFIDAGHEVMFVSSNKALSYLRQHFGDDVKEVFGLSFSFKNGKINRFSTVVQNLSGLPKLRTINKKLFREHFEAFGPDLVITDFEPFSAFWALRKKVPFISIGHEHLLTHLKLEHRLRNMFTRVTSEVVTRSNSFKADAYVIMNFFEAPPKKNTVVTAPPVIRNELFKFEPSEQDYIIVYTTTTTAGDRLLGVLNRFRLHKFIVYGLGDGPEQQNCILKPISTDGFLEDLAGAKGVIASAGFSLLSECLYFRKRMLLLPVPGQYEQITNAYYMHKLGLGVTSSKLTEAAVQEFFKLLDKPLPDDRRIIWPDNDRFFKVLQDVLNKLERPANISLAPQSA